jgi:hypothetical protein
MYLNKGEEMKRYILAGTAFLAIVLAVVFVFGRSNAGEIEQHGFWGNVTYSNCECGQGAYGDQVSVKDLSTGQTDYFASVCRNNQGLYDTELMGDTVYPPGDYQISLILHSGSDCEVSSSKYVTHGYAKQQVDLSASTPSGGS